MRTRLALAASLAGTLVLGVSASAQAVPAAPDLIVTVRKGRAGGDLVTVSARRADFPPDLLRQGIAALGARLGSGARGLEVHRESFRPNDPSAIIVKGSCGVDGLIAADGGLALAPLAQAFSGAPAPYTVRRLLVSFDGVAVTNRTPYYHTFGPGSDLGFVGRAVGSSVEYDVQLRSQEPDRLVVSPQATTSTVPAPKPRSGTDPLTAALIAASVAAAGALVYCLVLLLGRRPIGKS